MTLRGSVASFPLETIVQLLAATAKTGQLEVRSGGESGTLGFAEGRLVAAVSGDDGGDTALGAVFTISDGDFEFVPWGEPPESNLAGDLSQLLDRAVVQRDKIVADRQVISHDNLRFALSERAASGGDVRLSAEQWRALLAVNGQRDLRAMAAQLRLGRLATLAMLAELVRAGIIEVTEGPPEPPSSGPGSGPPGGGGGSEATFTAAPPVRDWDRQRSDAVSAPYIEPAREPEPEPQRIAALEPERTVAAEPEPVTAVEPERIVAPEPERIVAPEPEPIVAAEPEQAVAREPAPEVAAAWEAPPPIPPRETRDWDDLAVTHGPAWDQSAPAPELEKPSWEAWDSPTPSTPPPAPQDQSVPPASWDAPAEQTRAWQAPAAPTQTARDWGLPAQDWEKSSASGPASSEGVQTEATGPDAAPSAAEAEHVEDREATAGPPGADRSMDDRLSALSGLFGGAAAKPAARTWPDGPGATQPVVRGPEKEALPAEEPKKKGGLFSGLFKKDEPQARTAPAPAPAAATGARVAKLAVLANALLDEFNNGQYGKGRVDDRVSNLLMRVDEQADPIDRPLPIIDDRIDVPTLERANMSEQQVAPYLALLVSQIYQDAEHTFGKDKAKRGFKTVQAAVVGDPAALGTDLRLPRV